MTPTPNAGTGSRFLKITAVVLGSILGLFLLVTILLLTVLEPYAASLLKRKVSQNTAGLYQLEFEDLEIDLFTTSLTLNQLYLYPDTSVYRQQKSAGRAAPVLLNLKAPLFKISRLDVLDFILEDHLRMEKLLVENPAVRLCLTPESEAQKKTANSSIAALQSLSIGELAIKHGSFSSFTGIRDSTAAHSISDFSVQLLQLQADLRQQKEPDQNFMAEDLRLSAKNYVYQTPDGVYDLRLGLLTYSSSTQKLLLEQATVSPNPAANRLLEPDSAYGTLYQLDAPQLAITGLDLPTAYQNKTLLLKKIDLQGVNLNITKAAANDSSHTSLDPAQLYEGMARYLEKIQLEELSLSRAKFAYYQDTVHSDPLHTINRLDIVLRGLQLDSSTMHAPKINLPVQEILLTAEEYAYQDAGQPTLAKIGRIHLSTREKKLQAAAISLISDLEKNDQLRQNRMEQRLLNSLDLPELHILGFDLLQAYASSSLNIESIELLQPSLELQQASGAIGSSPDTSQKNLLQPLWAVVDSLQVDTINVQNASFIQHGTSPETKAVQLLENADLLITALQLDSATLQQKFLKLPLKELKLSASNYRYRQPGSGEVFSLCDLNYSSLSGTLSAKSIFFNFKPAAAPPVASTEARLYDLAAKEFKVAGLDLVKAINSNQLEVASVLLKYPIGVLVQNRDATSSTKTVSDTPGTAGFFGLFSTITAQTVQLEDGAFTYHEKQEGVVRTQVLEQVSVTASGLKLEAEQLAQADAILPMEELRLTARDYTYLSPDSIYTITLDSLYYSSRSRRLNAALFKVATDREAHKKLKATHPERAGRNLFDITARNFSIAGFDLIRAFDTGQFYMSEMVLTEPEVNILQDQDVVLQLQHRNSEQDSTSIAASASTKPDTLQTSAAAISPALEQIAAVVESFRVDKVQVNRGRFQFSILKDTIERSHLLEQVWVALQDLRLTSLQSPDPLQMFAVADLEVLIRDYTYYTPDSLYAFKVKEVRSSLESQSLQIDSLFLIPLLDREAFQEQISFATDHYTIKVPGISLQRMDLSALFNRQHIIAEELSINQPKADIFRDNRKGQDPDRRPPTLQGLLRQAGVYIDLDSVYIRNGSILYSDIAPKGVAPGMLILNNMNIAIANVTNDSLQIRQNSLATASGSTSFMDESRLQVGFVFHLDHPEDLYTYEGSLQPMPFSAMNPLIKNLMFAKIKSGQLDGASFSVVANKHMAEGSMRFLYHNLGIALIDKENPEDRGFKEKAGTWLLNTLVIKNNNPSRLGNFRPGEIEVDRLYNRSVFNHMGKAMVSGIISSLMPGIVESLVDKFTQLP